MTDDCADLRKLNRDTFRAEEGGETKIDGRGWKEFLQGTLADEFQIRRAKAGAPHQRQGKEEMIAWIGREASASRRVLHQQEFAWCNEGLGVVTCPISFGDKEYQNVKVFKRSAPGRWQCVYWQVTQLTREA